MTKHAHAAATPSVNAGMTMSPEARARMRWRARDVFAYYDDMDPGRGNCTWGAGILAHKGPPAALLGKVMVVRRDSVMFNGKPCRAPELTRHREDAMKYMREGYHARVGYLGLPDTITVVDLDCTEAFLKRKGKILVFWQGYFYDATRQPSAKR